LYCNLFVLLIAFIDSLKGFGLVVWLSVSALAAISEVDVRRAWLVLRWATVSGFSSRCGTFISVCNQPVT